MAAYTWVLIIVGWFVSTLVSYLMGSRSLRYSNYNSYLRDVIEKIDKVEGAAIKYWVDGGGELSSLEIIHDIKSIVFHIRNFGKINKKFVFPSDAISRFRESITKDIEAGGELCEYSSLRVKEIIKRSYALKKILVSEYSC